VHQAQSLQFVTFEAGVRSTCLALFAAFALVPAASAAPPTTDLAQQHADIAALTRTVLGDWTTNTAAGRWYADGVWHNPSDVDCWSCLDSAATAAAIVSRAGASDDVAMRQVAIDTWNTAISTEQNADGSFNGSPLTNSPMTTAFVGVELGLSYLELQDTLDPATRASWADSIERLNDYLIDSGQTTWYINGNANLRQVEDLWLAWRITGEQRFADAYAQEWTFTTAPPQPRWQGFGLQVSGDSGYLAESSAGATPGFDPWYTTVQLDTATELWILTHDRRYLDLMNLEFNAEQPLIDSNWMLNATNGSRKNSVFAFYSVAPDLLVYHGLRPDLVASQPGQIAQLESQFSDPGNYNNPTLYKGLSAWMAMILLDEQWPDGMADGTRAQPSAPAELTTTATTTASAPAQAVEAFTASGSPAAPAVTVTPANAVADRLVSLGVVVGVAASTTPTTAVVAVNGVLHGHRARGLAVVGATARAGQRIRVRIRGPRTFTHRDLRGVTRLAVRVTVRARGSSNTTLHTVVVRARR
jgi:hypothetical protein